MNLIRVLLAEDHAPFRSGIRALLQRFSDIQVVAETGDGRDVFSLVEMHDPDVVLMDIGLPGLNGIQATKRVVKDFPSVRMLILSIHTSEGYGMRSVQALPDICQKRPLSPN